MAKVKGKLEKAIKEAVVIGAGALVGSALEATGKIPKSVSGPAVGVIAGSFVVKKFRGVDPLAISVGVGLQAMKTIPTMSFYQKLEARAAKIGGKSGGGGARAAGGGAGPLAGAEAQANAATTAVNQAATAERVGEKDLKSIENALSGAGGGGGSEVTPEMLQNLPTP